MTKEYQVEGVYVQETTDDEYQVETVCLNETVAPAPAAGGGLVFRSPVIRAA